MGRISRWTKWWLKGEEASDRNNGEEPDTSASSDHWDNWDDAVSPGIRSSVRPAPRSLENHAGSPAGSRASSIASGMKSGSAANLNSILGSRDSFDGVRWGPQWGQQWEPELSSMSSEIGFAPPKWRKPPANASSRWQTNASRRPLHEPPVLDFRKYEEGGTMYDSLVRHPDTNPEEWYAYTDLEIERDILGDYSSWLREIQREASTEGNGERLSFYRKLSVELDKDRWETENDFEELQDRLYTTRQGKEKKAGTVRRTQKQFDHVRKIWREVNSLDSTWDEREWEIFGGEHVLVFGENSEELTPENLVKRKADSVAKTMGRSGRSTTQQQSYRSSSFSGPEASEQSPLLGSDTALDQDNDYFSPLWRALFCSGCFC